MIQSAEEDEVLETVVTAVENVAADNAEVDAVENAVEDVLVDDAVLDAALENTQV